MNFIKTIIPKPIYKIICKTYDELFYILNKNKIKKNNYQIISDDETIRLLKKGYSLTRFGDGEFKWMLGIKQVSFQDDNVLLSKRLKEVIKSNEERLLIGIPNSLNNFNNLNHKAKVYFTVFLNKKINKIELYLKKNKKYSNSNITRPYIDYKNSSIDSFNKLKSVWDNLDILIVEGLYTRFGVGNDLLNNAKSVQRILCPATNAFNKYDEILKNSSIYKDKLVLVCLGPTATILVYDLYKLGVQAIDIGHFDIEYMWFLNKAKTKQPIKGKYVNEAKNNNNLEINDINYSREIIKKIL